MPNEWAYGLRRYVPTRFSFENLSAVQSATKPPHRRPGTGSGGFLFDLTSWHLALDYFGAGWPKYGYLSQRSSPPSFFARGSPVSSIHLSSKARILALASAYSGLSTTLFSS